MKIKKIGSTLCSVVLAATLAFTPTKSVAENTTDKSSEVIEEQVKGIPEFLEEQVIEKNTEYFTMIMHSMDNITKERYDKIKEGFPFICVEGDVYKLDRDGDGKTDLIYVNWKIPRFVGEPEDNRRTSVYIDDDFDGTIDRSAYDMVKETENGTDYGVDGKFEYQYYFDEEEKADFENFLEQRYYNFYVGDIFGFVPEEVVEDQSIEQNTE